MMVSLENHVNNLPQLYDCKCLNKSNQKIRIKHKDKNVYTNCKSCFNKSKQSLDSLKTKYPNTFQLVEGNINKFILLLEKGIYPYEYMDNWRFKSQLKTY